MKIQEIIKNRAPHVQEAIKTLYESTSEETQQKLTSIFTPTPTEKETDTINCINTFLVMENEPYKGKMIRMLSTANTKEKKDMLLVLTARAQERKAERDARIADEQKELKEEIKTQATIIKVNRIMRGEDEEANIKIQEAFKIVDERKAFL